MLKFSSHGKGVMAVVEESFMEDSEVMDGVDTMKLGVLKVAEVLFNATIARNTGM